MEFQLETGAAAVDLLHSCPSLALLVIKVLFEFMYVDRDSLSRVEPILVEIIQKYEDLWRHFPNYRLFCFLVILLSLLAQFKPNSEGFSFE